LARLVYHALMCGRYFQYRSPAAVARAFEAINPLPNTAPSFNRAPTQDGLVLRRHPETGARHLDALRWGLVPHWAKDPSVGSRMINARSEGLTERPAFREAFRKRRCIVTADGFYEWQVSGKAKQPFAIAMADGAPMPLAGLWEGWRGPDGSVLRSFTIVTTAANPRLAAMHERMPVILPREAWSLWLGEEPASEDALLAALRPFPGEALRVWPVAARVGRVSENDAGLLTRDPLAVVPAELDDTPPAMAE
jgi:putative SOS response-associated peptidase YedK